jgi:hypothetical protein
MCSRHPIVRRMTIANRTGISSVRARRAATTVLTVAACALSAKRAHAEPFTLVVMPDTQSEATNTPQVKFPAITQWIVDNRAARNIRFVAHVGDLVNWDTPFSNPPHFQYVNASAAMAKLDVAAIPYSIAVGNHDTAAVGGINPDGTPCYCGGSAGPGNTHVNVRNTSVLNQFGIRCAKPVLPCCVVRRHVWVHDSNGSKVVGASSGVEGERQGAA